VDGPSRGIGAIFNRNWRNVGGGDGFLRLPDPYEKDFVYSDRRAQRRAPALSTGEKQGHQAAAGAGEKELRFNWNTPSTFPVDPGTLYIGAQFSLPLARPRDPGSASRRLTTNIQEAGQLLSGGLSIDNSSAENHTTIYSIAESPKNPDLLWVGPTTATSGDPGRRQELDERRPERRRHYGLPKGPGSRPSNPAVRRGHRFATSTATRWGQEDYVYKTTTTARAGRRSPARASPAMPTSCARTW